MVPVTAVIPDKAGALRELLVEELRSGRRPPGSRMPSELELGRACGVSRTTVRAALAELASAGLVVRHQGRGTFVHDQAERRLGGRPAAALRVGMAMPGQRLVNPIFQAIIARFVARLDPRARLGIHHHDFLKPDIYAAHGADLMVVDGGYGGEAIAALAARFPRLVVLNRLHRELPFVCTDNRAGGALMAEHVLARGHRRIGILHYGAEGTEEEFVLRLRGIRQALKAAGVEPAEAALRLHDHRAFTPFQAVELLLRRTPDITALLCITDSLALAALEALEEAGVAVPGRLSLVGFDDLAGCRFTAPALTTVRQPVDDLGDALAAAVTACLDGAAPRLDGAAPRLDGAAPRLDRARLRLDRPLKPQLVARASVAGIHPRSTP